VTVTKARARVATVVLLAATAAGTGATGSAQAVAADDPFTTESARTVTGTGEFADFSLTVGKTDELINENVRVSWRWSGAEVASRATPTTNWADNFISVMQCGGDASGPSRERCQYGAFQGGLGGISPNTGILSRLVTPAADVPPTPAEVKLALTTQGAIWDPKEQAASSYDRRLARTITFTVGGNAQPDEGKPVGPEGFNAYEFDDPTTERDESAVQRVVLWELLRVVDGRIVESPIDSGQSRSVSGSQSAQDRRQGCGADVISTDRATRVAARANCRGSADFVVTLDIPDPLAAGEYVVRYRGRIGTETVTQDIPVTVAQASGTACSPGSQINRVDAQAVTCELRGVVVQAPSPATAGAPDRLNNIASNAQYAPGIVSLTAANGLTQALPSDVDGQGVLTSAATDIAFSARSSNEVPLGRVNADGTGEVFFEMQNGLASPWLGCGGAAQFCWLVAVPRSTVDVDGHDSRTDASNQARFLFSSPLSLTNWDNRLQVPLAFRSLADGCRVGVRETTVQGNEAMRQAAESWKLPVCRDTANFSFIPQRDVVLRDSAGTRAGLFLTGDAAALGRPGQVAAPVAGTALVIGFNVEEVHNSLDSPATRERQGRRVPDLKLTPRLIAKLLTESYQGSVAAYDTISCAVLTSPSCRTPELVGLKDNPVSLFSDPEFYAVNADTLGFAAAADRLRNAEDNGPGDLYTIDGDSAWLRALWEYVAADPAAKAFIDGAPDESGMTVNPLYKGLAVPRADTPRLETSCWLWTTPSTFEYTRVPLCFDDRRPSMATFDEGAGRASRGREAGFVRWDGNSTNGFRPIRADVQVPGERALFTLTTAASAQQRGLATARLPNASGAFVGPTSAAMTAAISQSQPTTVDGVLQVDPTRVTGTGYPLTQLMYGVTRPTSLTPTQCEDFADFLTVAGGGGQVPGDAPGQLPAGYVPLNAEQKATLATAVAEIAACPRPAAAAPPAATPLVTTSTPATSPGVAGTPQAPATARASTPSRAPGSVPAPAPLPAVSAESADASAPVADADVQSTSGQVRTPGIPLGPLRWLVPVVLVVGLAGVGAGPLLAHAGRRSN